jgi:Tfp pilus assembly protein PilO
MAGKEAVIIGYLKRLSNRERLILIFTLLTVLSGVLYKIPYAMQVQSMNSLKVRAVGAEREILDLTAQIADLHSRAAEIKAGGPIAVRGRELIDQKGVVLFLEDVSGEARRMGVSLVSVHPSQEVDKENYKEISMSLDLQGRYREIAAYFKRLEGLSKIVSLRKIRVESCPDSSSVCAVQVEAVAYMAK